jgi:hypothetical protein
MYNVIVVERLRRGCKVGSRYVLWGKPVHLIRAQPCTAMTRAGHLDLSTPLHLVDPQDSKLAASKDKATIFNLILTALSNSWLIRWQYRGA